MTPSYEDLQEQVRDLRDRLTEATGQNLAADMRASLGITTRQARILAMLYACPGTASVSLIWGEIFADQATGDGPADGAIKVQICYLRRQLVAIKAPPALICEPGFGYRLSTDLRSWLRARLDRSDMAVAA